MFHWTQFMKNPPPVPTHIHKRCFCLQCRFYSNVFKILRISLFVAQHTNPESGVCLLYLLQPGAEAHMPEVVGEEGARAVGRVPREQQPAEERDVLTGLHAAVQLRRSAQHQQLQRLQHPQLLLLALEQPLAELLPLRRAGALSSRLPLDRNQEFTLRANVLFASLYM